MRPGDGCQLTAAQTIRPRLRLEEEAAAMCRREGCEVSAAGSVTRGRNSAANQIVLMTRPVSTLHQLMNDRLKSAA